MSFWEEVRKGLEEGAHALKKGAEVVAEKTEETAKIAKLRYDIHLQRQSIKRTFTELGGHVFELAEHGSATVWDDEEVTTYIAAVRDARERIKKLEIEIAAVSDKQEKETEESTVTAEDAGESDDTEEPVKPKPKRKRRSSTSE